MAESSSDDEFCRVDSGSGGHDIVPRDTEFKVKIKYIPTVPKKKSKCFEYVLKKGIELPHFKELLGNKICQFFGAFYLSLRTNTIQLRHDHYVAILYSYILCYHGIDRISISPRPHRIDCCLC